MRKLSYIIIAASFLLTACADWFDVKPKRLTDEEELFSREDGFMEALTGAYIKCAKPDLYGGVLSYQFLEILAQRYKKAGEELQKREYYDFTTTNTLTSAPTKSIWSRMYNVIANLNNLIYWTDKNRAVFSTPGYYELHKGEALALRSYLYFDLFRMFGPVYKVNPTGKSIPYRTEFNRDTKELENGDKMLEHIINDLKKAEELLTVADNLDFNYTESPSLFADEFMLYRFKRMNLLAVKALLARVYMYQGNKTLAAKYAQEVIDSGKFQLLPQFVISYNNPKSEIIFGLHMDKMSDIITFTSSASTYRIEGDAFFNELFNTRKDGLNDMRVREGIAFEKSGQNYVQLRYKQDTYTRPVRYTVPMIRLPEMYYILAECAPTLREACDLLNEVRVIRGADELEELMDEEDRLAQLELEYRKEFYGEGQMWYFYKRHFFNTFLHCPIVGMLQANYVFSIPDDEFAFGGVSDNN